jgi:hypothetical protein
VLIAVATTACGSISGLGTSARGAPQGSPESLTSAIASPEPSVFPEIVMYAERYGISLEEAIRRTTIMLEFDSVPLRKAVGNRWAGGWMEHEPEFRYVIRLTGSGWEEFLPLAAQMPLPIHFIDGATHRESELLAAMDEIQDRLQAEDIEMSMYPDTHTGMIVLEGPQDPGAQLIRELEALTGVPIRYEYGELPQWLPGDLPSITP